MSTFNPIIGSCRQNVPGWNPLTYVIDPASINREMPSLEEILDLIEDSVLVSEYERVGALFPYFGSHEWIPIAFVG